jgi:hypothetical protein
MKGVSKSKNKVVSEDYNKCLSGEVIKGININLQLVNYQMFKVTVSKNALTAINTKNITLPNQSCLPFVAHKLAPQASLFGFP